MKSKNSPLAEHLQKEIQIRNYSPRRIHTGHVKSGKVF